MHDNGYTRGFDLVMVERLFRGAFVSEQNDSRPPSTKFSLQYNTILNTPSVRPGVIGPPFHGHNNIILTQ